MRLLCKRDEIIMQENLEWSQISIHLHQYFLSWKGDRVTVNKLLGCFIHSLVRKGVHRDKSGTLLFKRHSSFCSTDELFRQGSPLHNMVIFVCCPRNCELDVELQLSVSITDLALKLTTSKTCPTPGE